MASYVNAIAGTGARVLDKFSLDKLRKAHDIWMLFRID
jgi:hypothetical protein